MFENIQNYYNIASGIHTLFRLIEHILTMYYILSFTSNLSISSDNYYTFMLLFLIPKTLLQFCSYIYFIQVLRSDNDEDKKKYDSKKNYFHGCNACLFDTGITILGYNLLINKLDATTATVTNMYYAK